MPIPGSSKPKVDKELLLRDGQGLSFLAIIPVGQLQLTHHIVCWVLTDEAVIHSHLEGLMQYVVYDIYCRYLQDLIIYQSVIEFSDI